MLNYANIAWASTHKTKLKRVQSKQKHALRITLNQSKTSPSEPLFLGRLGYPAPDPRPSYPALGPRLPAPLKISTSSTSSYPKSSHDDHVYITFNGLLVILTMLTYSCHMYMF